MGTIRVSEDEWRPLCECHGERMHKSHGDKWDCAVRGREAARKRYHANPERAQAAAKAWRKRNPGRTKAQDSRVLYSVYAALLSAQEGRCAICQKEPHEAGSKRKTLCVDHNHATGRIRGLLCLHCNAALGMLADDEGRLLRALAYLRSDGVAADPEIESLRIKVRF